MQKMVPIIGKANQGQTIQVRPGGGTCDLTVTGWTLAFEALPLGRFLLTPAENSDQQHVARINDFDGSVLLTIEPPEDVLIFGDETTVSIAHTQLGSQRSIDLYCRSNASNSLAKSLSILSASEAADRRKMDAELRTQKAAALDPPTDISGRATVELVTPLTIASHTTSSDPEALHKGKSWWKFW